MTFTIIQPADVEAAIDILRRVPLLVDSPTQRRQRDPDGLSRAFAGGDFRRPDLVCGVVLEDPARFGTRSPRELLARGAARERARTAEVADLPAAVGRALETMPDAEALPGVWASQRTDPGLLLSGVVTPEVPWDEAMAALDVPALLLTGDRPGSARVGREGLATAARNPRIRTVLVPGAGHQVRRSDPQAFYRAVDAWLAEALPVD